MKWLVKITLLLGVCGFGLLSASPAAANTDPPEAPHGTGIVPGQAFTMVQMVSQDVIVDIGETLDYSLVDPVTGEGPVGYRVVFNCTFSMLNQGQQAEDLTVLFPIHMPSEDGALNILSIKVDGKLVDWQADEYDPEAMSGLPAWAFFEVTFPVGEKIEIKVSFTTVTQQSYYTENQRVTYLLGSGADWHGPIDRGKIVLRLPREAAPENLLVDNSSPGVQFGVTEVFWEFEDLEPNALDIWYATFISPSVRNQIADARERLSATPNNTSALFRLAQALYSVSVYQNFGQLYAFPELYQEGLEAIARAVYLAPDNVEFLELYLNYLAADLDPESYPLLIEEREKLRELSPVNQTLGEINWALENYYYQLTATAPPPATATAAETTPATPVPTNSATPTPTEVPVQSPTPEPTAEPEPAASPTPEERTYGGMRLDYLIALVVLGALTLLSLILGRVARRNR